LTQRIVDVVFFWFLSMSVTSRSDGGFRVLSSMTADALVGAAAGLSWGVRLGGMAIKDGMLLSGGVSVMPVRTGRVWSSVVVRDLHKVLPLLVKYMSCETDFPVVPASSEGKVIVIDASGVGKGDGGWNDRVLIGLFEMQMNNKTLVVVEVVAVGRVAVNMDTHSVVAVGLVLATIVAVSVNLEMQVADFVVHAAVEVLKSKPRLVVAVLAVVRAQVKMSKHVVVSVGLILAAMAAVVVKVEVRVVSVVVHAAVKVVKTEPRYVEAVLMMARVAVGMDTHAILVVGLSLAVMDAVSVKIEVRVMRVVVQAVGVVHKMITGAAPFVGLMVVVEMQTVPQVRTAAVTMVPAFRKTMASRVVIVSPVDMTAKVQGHAALVPSVTAGTSVDMNIHAVVAALAVGRAKVKMNKQAVVLVGLMLAAMVVVSVMAEMQVVGDVVHAAVKVLKTKTGLVVAVSAVGRVALMMIKHAVVVVCLMTAEMVAVPVKVKVHVMRVVVQAVGVVHKMITGAAPFGGLMVLVEMQTVSQVMTVVVMMVPELCTMLAWEGVSFTLMTGVLFVPMWGMAFAKSLISMIALLQPRPERSLTPVPVIEA